ncbi:30S ribosome-binding factor RbfA [Megalodesulfovibrio gigas]|uniref:Ribosome-binding factor A n=1 Tax=Megalodesulfovibrio gigas (strain ATCC 19364 / DSM 1382 / NCIMB 9332 / VKM B-1759) TaxID=1121448 RepID=T2GB87_MEGG1|nr:30S ribosome-binding factor RbfA [Megalodesulfovibrio gigas]AGW13396.1 putative ribosome-binding factor A [Megalodesulfovibrio gigas DSM 1382 = ATCC 19364]
MKRTDSLHARRLSDLILREVADILARDMGDPRLEGVVISGVRLNPNLRVAEVLYTMENDEARRQATAKALATACGRIRTLLGPRLRSRALPELRFVLDSFLEEVIYARPHEESGDDAPDGTPGDPPGPDSSAH